MSVDWVDVSISAGKVVAVFAFLLVNTMLLIWAERKLVADMQYRLGPMRAGPFGVLITLADGIKLFFKETVFPREIKRGVYLMAPLVGMTVAFLSWAVIPFGGTVRLFDREITLQVTDFEVSALWILAMSSIGVYGITLAGWSSGSKYPLLGGVRAGAQMISYEVSLGLAVVAAVFVYGTLSVGEIVAAPAEWYVFLLAPAAVIFFISGVAETNRAPFDLVEADSELVGGYHTEYSGIFFALFFLTEYINMITISAVTTTLFLGGPAGPWPDNILPWLGPIVWFIAKVWGLLFLYIWVRASLPRLRYDQLMEFGWKGLIPAAIAVLIIVSVARAFDTFGNPFAGG